MLDLPNLLQSLAVERPVFHSEADFQLALAWEIKRRVPTCDIRLEKCVPFLNRRRYVDIWITKGNQIVAIELKYPTRLRTLESNGEQFELRDHSAEDCGRYDFLKDIVRLQGLVAAGVANAGYALLLTNDPSYWSPPIQKGQSDELFRIHHGRELSGEVAWGPSASPGTTKGREASLTILGEHKLTWENYSSFSIRNGKFRYLLIQVGPL